MIEPPGHERTHVLNPPPGGLTHAHFRLWMPDGLPLPRAILCISDHATGQLYGDVRWRCFAAEQGMALILMSLRRPPIEPGVTNLAPDADGHGALGRALEVLGEKSRHPGLEDCPRIFTGLAKSAQQAQAYADLSAEKTLAVIPWQGTGQATYREALSGAAATAPQLHASAELDQNTPPSLIAAHVAEAHALGLPWTHMPQGNLEYQLIGDPDFAFVWLKAVLRARLPAKGEGPLRAVDAAKSWTGHLDFAKDGAQVLAASVRVGQAGKGKAGAGFASWLPDAATAKAWKAQCQRKDANDPGL